MKHECSDQIYKAFHVSSCGVTAELCFSTKEQVAVTLTYSVILGSEVTSQNIHLCTHQFYFSDSPTWW